MANIDPKKTYVGVVENNVDPKKLGRCQIRVMDVYEKMETKDLPWATPWKDLNGNQFNVPDKGKVVTVVFENGNQNNPEYISSDHYNINLEKKLSSLNDSDYVSMKSLLFDHKTQLYVNDGEGLKMDHKFNNINIKEQSININLKDNFGKVNIGTQNSTQRAILGDNFTEWFDTFLNILMGAQGGSFLGNLAAPVVATPALMSHIQLYFQLKDPKILSKNVYIVDNEDVKVLEKVDETTYKGSPARFYDPTIGDVWNSTVEENKITKVEEAKFQPIEGASTTTFEKPDPNSEKPVALVDLVPEKVDTHPDVDVLLELIKMKNYKLYDKPYELNIISIRNQCLNTGDNYTDEFVDKLYALYKDDKNNWKVKKYVFSTMPGVEFTITENWIKESKFSSFEQLYWTSKINQKVSIKEIFKGPQPDKITNDIINNTLSNIQTLDQDQLKKQLDILQGGLNNLQSGLVNNIQGQGQNISNNLQGQSSNIVGNISGQGQSIMSNLQGVGSLNKNKDLLSNNPNLKKSLFNTIDLSNVIPMNDIGKLSSFGVNVDKITNDLVTVKSLGIDPTKITDTKNLSEEEVKKLSENKVDISKLKSNLNLISNNTQVDVNSLLKQIKLL